MYCRPECCCLEKSGLIKIQLHRINGGINPQKQRRDDRQPIPGRNINVPVIQRMYCCVVRCVFTHVVVHKSTLEVAFHRSAHRVFCAGRTLRSLSTTYGR
ncbi:Protein of unknown function [Pyronema omphalodes CBS 100304]|uniref:Uncharacterized protein n=1 Tax=Pyronema omphalodes (strain CBS 100304) TaxID=1076935 RepID=U4LDB2_PYROM|nr:Protein of unknown function [Pyronema omphalodes CBS 100304]